MIYNKVILTFDIDLLLNEVQLRSIYSTQDVDVTKSVTDAELDLARFNLRDAASDLYKKLQSLTRKSSTPFLYNVFNTGMQKYTIVYELWMNENWDTTLSQPLNIACQKLLVNYTLRDWYATSGQQLGYQVAANNYTEAEKDIRQLIDSRKTPTRRPTSYF